MGTVPAEGNAASAARTTHVRAEVGLLRTIRIRFSAGLHHYNTENRKVNAVAREVGATKALRRGLSRMTGGLGRTERTAVAMLTGRFRADRGAPAGRDSVEAPPNPA